MARPCPTRSRAIGADVVEVPVYRWTLPVDPLPGQRLVEAVAERRLDAVTFTSSPAVTNFLRVADSLDDLDRVHEALAGPVSPPAWVRSVPRRRWKRD